MTSIKIPPYYDFPSVTDGKILLRQIQDSDSNDLIPISFYDGIPAKTAEEAMEMNSKINQDYENGNSFHWVIVELESNKIVGTCGYYRGFENQEGELGCVLLPQYYGKGFMTSAMSLAIDFGQKTIGLKRIWAATNQDNHKAIQLLERLNFRKVRLLEDKEVEFELV